MAHVIRLRGPWELAPLDSASAAQSSSACRCEVPGDLADVLGQDFRGPALLARRFNTPTNLDPHERVHLVLAELPPRGELSLNGTPLPRVAVSASDEPERHDITPLLKPHNTLEIRLQLPCPALGGVHLEIG